MMFRKTVIVWLCAVSCLLPTCIFAQISGTKVIGPAPSDYTTFTLAVTALNSAGVNGPVIFQVKPGTYNEKIAIGAVNGTSATNTITFESLNHDSTSVTLSYTSSASATNNYVIRLNGTDYVTFRQMTIQRTDTLAYAQVIDMSSGATHNTFSNNIIKGITKASISTFAAIVGSSNALEDSYNVFTNNVFMNGSFGLYLLGQGNTLPDPGTQILNNTFTDQNYRAIYLTSQRSVKINNNIIRSSSLNSNYVGIYAQYANDSLRILKNKLELSTGTGMYLANCNETSSIRGLIANNFISVGGTSTAYGISINNVKLECIYDNSIHIYSSSAASGRAIYLNGSNTATLYIINNVLANSGGGYCFYVDPATTTPITSSNYNDLFTSGSAVGFWKGTGNTALLGDWRTASALDANSVSADPLFTSSTDLHATSGNIHAAGTGALLYFPVTDDIDMQLRSNPPDIGADEFNIEDLGISTIASVSGICPGTGFQITVYVRNFGLWAFSGSVPLHYQIQGASTVNATTPTLSLNPGDTATYTFSTVESLYSSGSTGITAGTGLTVDINPANDAITDSIHILPSPPADAGPDQPVCVGDSATLTATGGTGYTWSTIPPAADPTIHVLVADTTLFYVTVAGANGCIATDSAYVFPALFPAPDAGFTYILTNLQASMTNSSTGALTYLWDFGDGSTDTAANPVHNYATTGSYIVKLTAINPCDSDTISQSFFLAGIAENKGASRIRVTPNPASDFISIGFEDLSEAVKNADISDITGRIIGQITGAEIGNGHKTDIRYLANGLYFLNIYSENRRYVIRFIVRR